jgi:hypothetical protein
MDLSVQTDLRVRLFKAGYSPLPLQGKVPPMEGWQQKTQTNTDEIKLWSNLYPYCGNTGILTRLAPTLDIDIMDEAAAEAVEELARDRFEERGWFLVRIGKAPKRAVLLRTLAPFKKAQLKLIAPNGATAKIEILADGQQVVVAGDHPETLRPYTWHGGEPWLIAAEELPYISEAEAHTFLTEAGELLARGFGYTIVGTAQKTNGANGHDDHSGTTAGDWGVYLSAILTGTDLHDATTALAAKLITGGLSGGASVRLLRAILGASSAPHDQRWRERYDDLPRAVRTARDKIAPRQQQTTLPNATVYIFPMIIPKREWLYGGHYVRGAVTATVAPGGFGKTTLVLYELLTMAQQGYRVWYISGEDSRDEIDRRIAAHCQHNKVDPQQLAGRLFVDDKISFPLVIGRAGRGSSVDFENTWLTQLEAQIRANHIDVVALDPFISFHTVAEGDNGAIDQIIKRLGTITQATQCVIELSHHVRKSVQGLQAELTVDDSRGGSAIVNAVRSARVFNRMSANEAALVKISANDRSAYIRIDKGKRNMAPPEHATWWKIVSVLISNGDNVQAIEPYAFDALGGITTASVDWVQVFLKEGGPRRASSQSPDWLGHHIGRYCGREDTNEKAGAIWANKIIGQWLTNKVFKKVQMRDPETRKPNILFYADNEFHPPDDGNVVPFPRPKDDI